MSCIAGPRQFGNEDQGWVAHFLYSALSHKPITVYGNGLQVRDILHVYDLLDAMAEARNLRDSRCGQVYNLGGGMERAVSVLEMLRRSEDRIGEPIDHRKGAVRPGDQPLYISDTSKFTQHTGWRPMRSMADTLEAIHEFWLTYRAQIASIHQRVDVPGLAEEVA
jgi:CDP-paratose 2-epimerase